MKAKLEKIEILHIPILSYLVFVPNFRNKH